VTKRSMTYEELIAAQTQNTALDPARLTDATLARAVHLGRFFESLTNALPNPNLKIRDVLSEDDVAKIWNDTADPNYVCGPLPAFN
jgi:hypothetical protein